MKVFLTATFTPKPIHLLQHPQMKHMFCLASNKSGTHAAPLTSQDSCL